MSGEVFLDDLEEQFSLYDEALKPVNSSFPQRQGLLLEEFRGAIQDPSTRTTVVTTEHGIESRLPQLYSIEHNSWLNSDYYYSSFPDSEIQQFKDIAEVEPGQEVREGLLELAAKGGVLAFDYPDNDPEYPARVLNLLEELGIKAKYRETTGQAEKKANGEEVAEPDGPVNELGHQAYYSGKVELKKGYDPTQPSTRLGEGLRASHYTPAANAPEDGEPSSAPQLPPEMVQTMYETYLEAFKPLENYPCRQGYSWDEFYDMATEETETEKVVYSIDGEPAVICILGDDLSKYDWINPGDFARLYPDDYKNRQIIYFPGMASKGKGQKNMFHLLDYICQSFEQGNSQPRIAFDCCDWNIGFLNKYLEEEIGRTPDVKIKFDKTGTQIYAAVQLSLQ